MFERNKVDNCQDRTAVAARIELDDGRFVSGRFLIARSKSLIDILNGPAQFIDFEPYDGDKEVISKSSIRRLRTLSASSYSNPSMPNTSADEFNPYGVLGLDHGAGRSAIRAAYRQQSMKYHPDRYSSVELPGEVVEYLEAMARRINAAYDMLSTEATGGAQNAARSEPVYTSSPAP